MSFLAALAILPRVHSPPACDCVQFARPPARVPRGGEDAPTAVRRSAVTPTADDTTRLPDGSPEESARREVSLGGLGALVIVGVAALAVAVYVSRVEEAIGLTAAAACLALVTLPVQRALQRWIGSVASLVTTAIATLAAVVTIAYVVLRDLGTQAEVVADLVRERLDEIQAGSFADRVVNALELDRAIDEWLTRVPSLVVVGSEGS